jgi:hypothetical protein
VFVLIGALLVAAGVYLGISGGITLQRCLSLGIFSPEVWSSRFWLLSPEDPSLGMGINAHWFVRLVGAVVLVLGGARLVRFASR